MVSMKKSKAAKKAWLKRRKKYGKNGIKGKSSKKRRR
jgi:hypothetical protein